MSYVEVNFEHWRSVLHDDWLVRYGSPHFEPSRARNELCERCAASATRVFGPLHVPLSRLQVFAANEAFPEAAVADPIGDLELWEEWNSGIRTFPYPGRYSRLGLTTQEGKTSSTSSVGVLGEIMAGLFSQAWISPWVLVRVVRRWPDFIYYTPADGRHAFVEAKGFTTHPDGDQPLLSRVHGNLLGELAVQAVAQLNADPFVKVWGAFTHVRSISPLRLDVTFVEFDCGDSRRSGTAHRVLPQALIGGLAARAIAQGAAKLTQWELEELRTRPGRKGAERRDVQSKLASLARWEVEQLLLEAGPGVAINSSRKDLDAEIDLQVASASYPEREEGKRFFAARELAASGELAPIRQIGRHLIRMGDLTQDERVRVDREWRPDWSQVDRPLGVRGAQAWRCGGAVFSVEEMSP